MFNNPIDQNEQWNRAYAANPELFGKTPSAAAVNALPLFKLLNMENVLELGPGQGRDSFYFASSDLKVTALDYSDESISALNAKAKSRGLEAAITAVKHDLRDKLPFADNSFDACFSHMAFCAALTKKELFSLNHEISRVLKMKALNIFTVRNIRDPHFQKGFHHSEYMYETAGFIVQFFDKAMVKMISTDYEIMSITEFEEGVLPRKLYQVNCRNLKATES